MFFFLLLFCRI